MIKNTIKYLISVIIILIVSILPNKFIAINSFADSLNNIYFLDTKENGDSIIIQSRDKFALIDTGEDLESNAQLIANKLKDLGTNHLDYFIMSHAHSDHIGAFSRLSELITIDKFIGMDLGIDKDTDLSDHKNHPFYDKSNNTWKVPLIEVMDDNYDNNGTVEENWRADYYYQKMLISLSMHGIEKEDKERFIVPKENQSIKIGDFTLIFNNTFEKLDDIPEIKTDFNNSSTWITLSNGQSKIAFTGDIDQTRGNYIVNKFPHTNNVDLYKVSHHGLSKNTSYNIAEKLNPII